MTLAVRRCGHGPPDVVLVHGWGFNGTVWDTLTRGAPPGVTFHLVDLPGHGASPPPPSGCSLAEAARLLTDGAPAAAHWVGWSLGGVLALQVALAADVASLTLVASSPRFVRGPGWPHAVDPLVLEGFATELERDPMRTLAGFIALQARGLPAAREVARSLRHALAAGGTPSAVGLRAGLAWLRESDLRPHLRALRCPVQLIVGGRDTLVPPAVLADVRALRPDWRGTVIPGVGHAPFVSDPAGVWGLIREWVLDGH